MMSTQLVHTIDTSAPPIASVAELTEDPSAAHVLYVSGDEGDDANDGTLPTSALKTIQRAVDLAAPGDCVTILAQRYNPYSNEDATYAENVVIRGKPGLTLRGLNPYAEDAGACGPFLRARVQRKACITINVDSPDVRLVGLGIEGGNAPAIAVDAADVVLEDMTLDGNGDSVLVVRASGTTLRRCQLNGVTMLYGAHRTVEDTTLERCILTHKLAAVGDVDNVSLSACNLRHMLTFLDISSTRPRSTVAVNGCRFAATGPLAPVVKLPDGCTAYFDANTNAVGEPISLG